MDKTSGVIVGVLASAALLCAAPAASAAPDLAPAFAGTIVSTYPDGRQAKLWLNPDGSRGTAIFAGESWDNDG